MVLALPPNRDATRAILIGTYWAAYTSTITVLPTLFPALLDGVGKTFYVFYALFGLAVAWSAFRRHTILWTPGAWFATAFTALAALSLMWQPGGLAAPSYQRLFTFAMGLIVMMLLTSEAARNRVAYWLAGVGALIGAWTIYQSRTGVIDYSTLAATFADRGGVGVNPNNVSMVVSIGAIAIFAMLQRGAFRGRRGLLLGWLAFGVCAYANFILASRGFTIALAGALLFMIARRARDVRRTLPIAVAIIALVFGVTQLPGAENLLSRVGSDDVGTLNNRSPIWQAAWEAVGQRSVPQLMFGTGLGSSEVVVSQVFASLTSMHNVFLQMLFEYGVLGLALFTGMIRAVWLTNWRQPTLAGDVSIGVLVALLGMSLTATIADNFTFWVLIGWMLAARRRDQTSVPSSM